MTLGDGLLDKVKYNGFDTEVHSRVKDKMKRPKRVQQDTPQQKPLGTHGKTAINNGQFHLLESPREGELPAKVFAIFWRQRVANFWDSWGI